STCGIEFHVSRCPDCGGDPLPSVGQKRKALNNYSLLLAPGLLVGLLAYIVFPPLDAGPLAALGLCTFFLPLVMQLLSIVRKRLGEDLGRLRTIYVYSSLALLLLALLPLLNGWLDGSPARAVKTTVVQKTAVLHRSTTSYRLTVSSWRPGRSVEELRSGLVPTITCSSGKRLRWKSTKGSSVCLGMEPYRRNENRAWSALYHFTGFLLRFRVPLPNLHKLPEQIETRHCSGTPV